jgi:hypothetical protein
MIGARRYFLKQIAASRGGDDFPANNGHFISREES